MELNFSEESFEKLTADLFSRVKSFQTAGRQAYHPGLEAMELFDSLLGHPHKAYKTLHIAGTNGKGSISNMLAVALASTGLKVGLYTSPHLLDVRERIRILDFNGEPSYKLIPKEYFYAFCKQWEDSFEHFQLSFFEITTSIAFKWFEHQNVDVAVIETGLGGRLDSTNIITPLLSVISNVGLDHCDILGHSLPEIAFEKAGIIKPGVPVVVGESGDEQVSNVFRNKVIYSNITSPFADREKSLSLLHFADKEAVWQTNDNLLNSMDLQGPCQKKNLRTVIKSLEVLDAKLEQNLAACFSSTIVPAIARTASLAGFHGRWEKISDSPMVIADIGHNAHGLRDNFRRLKEMTSAGAAYENLIIVYGTMADKDWQEVAADFPNNAHLIFTRANSSRALPVEALCDYAEAHSLSYESVPSVADALSRAMELAVAQGNTLVYLGGSAFVVAEALNLSKRLV